MDQFFHCTCTFVVVQQQFVDQRRINEGHGRGVRLVRRELNVGHEIAQDGLNVLRGLATDRGDRRKNASDSSRRREERLFVRLGENVNVEQLVEIFDARQNLLGEGGRGDDEKFFVAERVDRGETFFEVVEGLDEVDDGTQLRQAGRLERRLVQIEQNEMLDVALLPRPVVRRTFVSFSLFV